ILLMIHITIYSIVFFFSSRRRHTRSKRDWSSDVCSSDLNLQVEIGNNSTGIKGQVVALNTLVNGTNPNGSTVEERGLTNSIKARSEERRVGKECRRRWAE